MKNKLLFIFIGNVFIILLGLISCEKCGPFPEKFKVIGFDFNTVSAIYAETEEQKLSQSEINNDTIVYNLYAISMRPKIEAIAQISNNNNSFNMINVAFACSPTVPKTDERIDSILISSNEDFDATHPSGTNLADLFNIVVYDTANSIYNEKFKLEDYIATKPSPPNDMVLILNSPPAQSQVFEFTVEYHQNGIDIDFFEFKTDKIFIKKE